MRSLTLFIGIIIVALVPCTLSQPPPPPAKQIPLINPEAHDPAAKLLTEFFPNWEQDVAYDPNDLPAYERWQHSLEEAYMVRPNMQAGSRTFRALQSRFTGNGAPIARQDVVFAVAEEQDGLEANRVTRASTRLLNAETHEEYTDEVAEATANALMEGIGYPVPGVGDNSYSIIDFDIQEITAIFAMALFPTSGNMATESEDSTFI